MGLISTLVRTFFGGGRNIIGETAEVFRENSEAAGRRAHDLDAAVLAQLAAEGRGRARGGFGAFVDALNRLPRPMMVLAVFSLLIWTPIDPLHMAEVFTAWALIPEGLWVVIGVVVTFYFGGRQQVKELDLQRDFAAAAARAPIVIENMKAVRALRHDSPGAAGTTDSDTALTAVAAAETDNPALNEILEKKART